MFDTPEITDGGRESVLRGKVPLMLNIILNLPITWSEAIAYFSGLLTFPFIVFLWAVLTVD